MVETMIETEIKVDVWVLIKFRTAFEVLILFIFIGSCSIFMLNNL